MRVLLGKLRSDRASGLITAAFGIAMAAFGSFGLLIVALQRSFLASLPATLPSAPNGMPVADVMHAIHGVWAIYLPIMIAGGGVFLVAGIGIVRGSRLARRVAQANALCGYAWLIAYLVDCYKLVPLFGPPPGLPESAARAFTFVTFAIGGLQGAAFPTGLLLVLARPRRAVSNSG